MNTSSSTVQPTPKHPAAPACQTVSRAGQRRPELTAASLAVVTAAVTR